MKLMHGKAPVHGSGLSVPYYKLWFRWCLAHWFVALRLSLKTDFSKRCFDAVKASDLLKTAEKVLDSAASKKVIHKNAAARTKSRLTAAVKKISK